MKEIKYVFLSAEINHGTEENPNIEQIFISKTMPYTEANLELARKECWEEPEIIDDGVPEPEDIPSQLDRVEAQVTYTAMMTDTLLEG